MLWRHDRLWQNNKSMKKVKMLPKVGLVKIYRYWLRAHNVQNTRPCTHDKKVRSCIRHAISMSDLTTTA